MARVDSSKSVVRGTFSRSGAGRALGVAVVIGAGWLAVSRYVTSHNFLPTAEAALFQDWLGSEQASLVLEQTKRVSRSYHWRKTGFRSGRDEIVTSGVQLCDEAVASLQRLLPGARIEEMDLAPRTAGGFTPGHSIAVLWMERRRIYIDPSRGLVWLGGERNDLADDLRKLRGFARIGRSTPWFDRQLGGFPTAIHDSLRSGGAGAEGPGRPLYINFLSMGTDDRDAVGEQDGTGEDIAQELGTYHSHLGNGNRLVHQVFPIKGADEACLVEFSLNQAEPPPLDFELAGGAVAGGSAMHVPNEAQSIFLFLARLQGLTQVIVKPAGNALGYRGLDQVVLHREFWSRLQSISRARSPATAASELQDPAAPVELRPTSPAAEIFPLSVAYWNRCIVEFIPVSGTKEYRFVYGTGDSLAVLTVEQSGVSRFAVSRAVTDAVPVSGIIGIIDESDKSVAAEDIRLLRLKPAESGFSIFTSRPDA